MDQADSVLSTPPTNTSAPSRRTFLAQAAAAAAAGGTLGTLLPLPSPSAATAEPEADPIYAVIEAHHKAVAVHAAAVAAECALEESLPAERTRSYITVALEKIIDTDDPRWLAAIKTRSEAAEALDDLGIDLVNVTPTTVAGVEALLRYVAYREAPLFPHKVTADDGSTWDFAFYLARHAADALRAIAPAQLSDVGPLRQ